MGFETEYFSAFSILMLYAIIKLVGEWPATPLNFCVKTIRKAVPIEKKVACRRQDGRVGKSLTKQSIPLGKVTLAFPPFDKGANTGEILSHTAYAPE